MMLVDQAWKHLNKKTNEELSEEQVQELLESMYTLSEFVIDVCLDNKRKGNEN